MAPFRDTDRTAPLVADDPAVERLREVLAAADFTGGGLVQALAADKAVGFRHTDVPVHRRRLGDGGPLAALIKLLWLGVPVNVLEVDAALAPLTAADLVRIGLAERSGDDVQATMHLAPFRDLLLVSDVHPRDYSRAPADWVAGVNPTALTLDSLTVRSEVAAALDVGTGCGIQALLAAGHSRRVVATDISPRALNVAAFNARLNGIANLELRQGNLFEPVAGERFELIVSNPPYVISPETAHLYRDSSLPGDTLSREVITQAARHLSEGGFAAVLCNWVHEPDGDWSTPLRAWVAELGCDAWLLRHRSEDALSYAAHWNRIAITGIETVAFERSLSNWLEYFREAGIETIGTGAVLLRRRGAAANWVRADELPPDRAGPASEQIQRIFAAHDLLESLPDDQTLSDLRLELVTEHRIVQTLVAREGHFVLEDAIIQAGEGIRFEGALDAAVIQLLASCDGSRPLRGIMADLARSLNIGPKELGRAALPVVRRLMELGFLVRAESAQDQVRPQMSQGD